MKAFVTSLFAFVRIAALAMLALTLFAASSFAKTNPLNNPMGLGVDASSNLYVANQGANQILIYNSGYVQQTSKTITAGIVTPTGLAVDVYGNLWVANYDTSNGGVQGSITEYTGGAMQSGNTIINGIVGPQDIAFDGLDNLYVNDNEGSLTIYIPTGLFGPPAALQQTISYPNLFAVGEAGGTLVTGSSTDLCEGPATQILLSGAPICPEGTFLSTFAFAADNNGGIYESDSNGNNVWYLHPGGTFTLLTTLPFTPSFNEIRMAVDNVKHRLYVSNRAGNQILVYSTASGITYGKLIHTIHN